MTKDRMTRRDACVLCQTSVALSRPEREGYRICPNCDVTWRLNGAPEHHQSDWAEDYYQIPAILASYHARIPANMAIVARIASACPGRGKMLDVGAGLGGLMQAAAQDGWEVHGIEPSPKGAEVARELTGADVQVGFLEAMEIPEAEYDLVTTMDVLRCVSNPMAFLTAARQVLRPGGVIMVREVYRRAVRPFVSRRRPDANRRTRGWEHIQCFSPRSLRYAFRAIGLEGVWIEPSPVFADSAEKKRLLALTKRTIQFASIALYRSSGRRILFSPNLLAFGRAPGDSV
ncbi:MAG: class I SAM-dependent methyltransferase [Planctomycetota bacterium]|nr:class I SAM-dependent methyltransferase [Planctomycetota bacterium]